jgi:DeoR family fructose operon transcriptional repressor
MSFPERKSFILEKIRTEGKVLVKEVVQQFNVAELTVRRDLDLLEKQALLTRIHGGAITYETVTPLFSFERKVAIKQDKKEQICRLAANFIQDNDILFIDCGSTLFRLCKYIRHIHNLRIITNSLPAVSELLEQPNIKVYIIGGELDTARKAVHGSIAQQNIAQYHAHKAFIGVDGVSLKNGLSSFSEEEAAISRTMAESSDQVFLLCDSSKIENDSFFKFAPLSLIHYLITDTGLEADLLAQYQEKGIQVVR